ncbi:MAG: hypothetical protein QOH36_492 [Actinomycetota bacterium]|jgi:hypothetical protein|nr:hypothetical protein [Actinomycetota bacterium]
MGRVARHGIVWLAAALLLGPGCSSGDGATTTLASTTSGPAPSGPETPTTSADPTATTLPESVAPDNVTDPPPASGPGATLVAPPAAQAGGWRLVLTHPTAGSSVGRVALLCYEVTGPSGEPDIGLEVALGGGAPIQVGASVGRGSADVDLGTTGYDPQDLHVQLIVDGQRLAGAAVTIPEVLVVPAAVDPDCP